LNLERWLGWSANWTHCSCWELVLCRLELLYVHTSRRNEGRRSGLSPSRSAGPDHRTVGPARADQPALIRATERGLKKVSGKNKKKKILKKVILSRLPSVKRPLLPCWRRGNRLRQEKIRHPRRQKYRRTQGAGTGHGREAAHISSYKSHNRRVTVVPAPRRCLGPCADVAR